MPVAFNKNNIDRIKNDKILSWKIYEDLFSNIGDKRYRYVYADCPQCNTHQLCIIPYKNIFYCRSCHYCGDVISAIQRAYKCSAMDSIQIIHDTYKVEGLVYE